ncbi:MAG: bifunctional metallophosphatase/5'-nucleotidase [Desulfuromonadaceae bacterium]
MDEKTKTRLTILHTNDMHGRYRPISIIKGSATSQTGDPGRTWDEFDREGIAGGFPSLATAVGRIRRERGPDNVLLVDGGDTFSDDLLGNLTRGEAVIRLMNSLGYQLMALGNHDYDFGSERTRELDQIANFPMRAANVVDLKTGRPFLGDPTVVFQAGGIRVGFLTLTYHNTGYTGSRKNYEGLEFRDGVEAVRQFLPDLRGRCDVVVVLSHLGSAMDRVLASEVPEMDIIIGAHSHDRISNERIGDVTLVQAVSDNSVLGEIEVSLDGTQIIKVESRLHILWLEEFPEDEEIARQVEALRAPYQETLEEVIAIAGEPIDRNYRSESPFDKLVGEIICAETGAEIAFMPGVGYGVTLHPGAITREALFTLIPHPAKLVTMRLTGDQILEILEQCATNQAPGDPRLILGGLVQTAGLRWSLDFAQPSGSRVSAVHVRGEALRKDKSYAIGTNAGMAGGLHRYTAFTQGQDVVIHDIQVNELVERAFAKMGTVRPPSLGDITLQGKE